eukprot:EG_transcript_8622
MGIQGLLPPLKGCSRAVHVSEYRHQRVGVDTYGWLHKGCIQCALELGQGVPTAKYIQFVMHRVDLLRHFKVVPVMVFDGGALPMKKAVDADRRRSRQDSVHRGLELLRAGQRAQAEECFQRAVDVTPEMACSLMQVLRSEGVEFLVAPYEADAQLAYLARTGYVTAVISEDSDLLAYQTPRVLFKMDKFGNGTEVRLVDLPLNPGMSFLHFTPLMILTVCILAGCDYLPNLPSIGVKTAHRLVQQYKTIDRILQVLQADPKFALASLSLAAYAERFQQAVLTFQHHYVYDPMARDVRHLEDPLAGGPEEWPFLGPRLDTATARSVCEGFAHPDTYAPYPLEPTADARLYRPTASHRLSGQDPVAPVAAAPPNAVELAGQRPLAAFFPVQPAKPAEAAVPQTQATRAPFVAPRVAPGATLADGPDAAADGELMGGEVGTDPTPKRRRVIRLSRFFCPEPPPGAQTEAAAAPPSSAPAEAEPEEAEGSPGSSPADSATPSSSNAGVSEGDSAASESACPHADPDCDGRHSVFYDCTLARRSPSPIQP